MRDFEKLVKTVNKYTKALFLEKDETKILLSEAGARILGITVDNSPNILWINPSLEEVLKKEEWNIGGLRVWVSPERNFFYKKPESFEEWFCPKGLDPNNYKVLETSKYGVSFLGEIEAYDYMCGTWLKGFIRRDIRILEGDEVAKLVVRENLLAKYMGNVNLWALAQVKPGNHGTVIVPVKRNVKPLHYFGPIPSERLIVKEDHVAFKIDSQEIYKLAIRPEDLPLEKGVIIAFITELEKNVWGLIALRSWDLPRSQEECLDVPKADPEGERG